ncbi:MAG: type IV secretory system conjugative DNA transfer family protein [Lachnospiraceae bacterium]|nr:type IV secretory system conjugative DNA transfer family protein [Lachnospiraceae bacterium]
MNRVILGEGCYLEGGIGKTRPNDNVFVVGSSGSGKSTSTELPTELENDNTSTILTQSKPEEGRKLANYIRKKGKRVEILDFDIPSRSTVTFDPLQYVESYQDVENLARNIVMADPNAMITKDFYWNDGAINLIYALMLATMIMIDNATMRDVLELFDSFTIKEDGKGITTSLDELFDNIEMIEGACPAVNAFKDYTMLPYTTAGCQRDSIARALRKVFPESIRQMMRGEKLIDFEAFANEKTLLMIITSPVKTSSYFFVNLMFSTAIKQLLEFSQRCEGQRLPHPVRLVFDDFACGARINDFPKHISVFRSAGISAMMLVQSESQLREMYTEAESETIINNCSVYVYFPGGMDLITCKHISQRLDVPLTDILYAPMGDVIVMQSSRKPVWTKRYDTFNSREYKEFIRATENHKASER